MLEIGILELYRNAAEPVLHVHLTYLRPTRGEQLERLSVQERSPKFGLLRPPP